MNSFLVPLVGVAARHSARRHHGARELRRLMARVVAASVRRPRLLLAAAAGALALTAVPARAGAIIGGEPVARSAVPWFVSFPNQECGGTLVRSDRVITAAHCLAGWVAEDLGRVRVGREVRRVVHIALAPGWQAATGLDYPDDIGIVGFDAPVSHVKPVALARAGARLPRRVRLLGRGLTAPPGRAGNAQGQLREAVLASLGDDACAKTWRQHPGKGEPFSAERMLCAIDADGRAPLSSGCNGDSGGPVYSGTHRRPRLLGVISWGGDLCGADHLPSVAAEVAPDRDFVLAPNPVWEPRPTGPVQISGDARVGATLTCTPPAFDVPVDTVTIKWFGEGDVPATGPTYTVLPVDAGRTVTCQVTASTAGGPASTLGSVQIAH